MGPGPGPFIRFDILSMYLCFCWTEQIPTLNRHVLNLHLTMTDSRCSIRILWNHCRDRRLQKSATTIKSGRFSQHMFQDIRTFKKSENETLRIGRSGRQSLAWRRTNILSHIMPHIVPHRPKIEKSCNFHYFLLIPIIPYPGTMTMGHPKKNTMKLLLRVSPVSTCWTWSKRMTGKRDPVGGKILQGSVLAWHNLHRNNALLINPHQQWITPPS